MVVANHRILWTYDTKPVSFGKYLINIAASSFTSPKAKINAIGCAYNSKTSDKPKPLAFLEML